MSHMNLKQLLRTSHVKRWQIVRVAREQTIAEHMYRVWVMVHKVCHAFGFTPEQRAAAERWALMHDQPEVITGDINTGVKKAIRAAVPDSDPLHHIELGIDEDYRAHYLYIKANMPEALALVKLCDMLEAIAFLKIEGMGQHAAEVRDSIWKDFRAARLVARDKWPQYEWDRLLTVVNILETEL